MGKVNNRQKQQDYLLEYIVPRSSHFLQYYDDELFKAIHNPVGINLRSKFDSILQQLQRIGKNAYVGGDSISVIKTSQGNVHILTSKAATIAHEFLLESDLKRLKQRVFVTSVDYLLTSYFTHSVFGPILFKGKHIAKKLSLKQLSRVLLALKPGISFEIRSNSRGFNVKVLPLPKHENFFKPYLCLIGPEESDFVRASRTIGKDRKWIVIETKRNLLYLTIAYLLDMGLGKIAVKGMAPMAYMIFERDGTISYMGNLAKFKGDDLAFLVQAREGNVDGFTRDDADKFIGDNQIIGVFGLDIVQTGKSLRENRLKIFEKILPMPLYPVQVRLV